MTHLQVFDPPMCCSTGVCGPQIDPKLPRFAADLQWFQKQGLVVERYNLTQQPQNFVQNAVVKQALVSEGEKCLPLVLGAAIGANCEPCFKYHFQAALEAGATRDDIAQAVATARKVKQAAAKVMLNLAGEYLAAEREVQLLKITPCCVPGPDGTVQRC